MPKLIIQNRKDHHKQPFNTTESTLRRLFQKFETEDAREYSRQKEISIELNKVVRTIFKNESKQTSYILKVLARLFRDYFSQPNFFYYEHVIQVLHFPSISVI